MRRNRRTNAITALILTGLIISFLPGTLHAREWASWCKADPAKGWHFYCDDPEPQPKVIEEPVVVAPPPPALTAQEQLEKLQQELEEARAQAVMEPTEDNIKNYLTVQSKALERSGEFADVWRRVVWQNPEFDYEGRHPQSHIGKLAAQAELTLEREKTLDMIRENYAIIYVGSQSCAVCRAYGPNLRRFAENNLLTVLAVSIDGSPLAGWEGAGRDEGQLRKLGVDTSRIPLTMLYEKTTNKVTVLGVGNISDSELGDRIHTLISVGVGDAF